MFPYVGTPTRPEPSESAKMRWKTKNRLLQAEELGSWEAVGTFERENKVCRNYFVYPVKCEFETAHLGWWSFEVMGTMEKLGKNRRFKRNWKQNEDKVELSEKVLVWLYWMAYWMV